MMRCGCTATVVWVGCHSGARTRAAVMRVLPHWCRDQSRSGAGAAAAQGCCHSGAVTKAAVVREVPHR